MPNVLKTPRLEVVDALRGFAIFSIMLLHNLEHFDFYYFPEHFPAWLKVLDSRIWKTLFFLFSGKSYAIFSLLFGLTFYIQFNNQQKKGIDFRNRFLWRLFLLFLFGIINSMFFEGDILSFYAVLGIFLVPLRKLNNKIILAVAIFLMLQPLEWVRYFYLLFHPDVLAQGNMSSVYFAQIGQYLGGGSFWDVVKGNLTTGRLNAIFWSWENGRFFQTVSLFLLGMLLGRQGRFSTSIENSRFWKNAFVISAISFIVLFILRGMLHSLISRDALYGRTQVIINSWNNFAFTILLVSSFVVMYQKLYVSKILKNLVPFGQMSLSNYVSQSIVGAFIYYGFGLGLYKYTGATYCLFIGLGLAFLQLYFCRWWLKNHKQGPLEYIWHKATWI